MLTLKRIFAAFSVAALITVGSAACTNERGEEIQEDTSGVFEDVGEAGEEAAEDVGQAGEDIGEAGEEAAEDTGEAFEENVTE